MHRGWDLPELRHQIFDVLGNQARNGSLFQLARTCHLFSDQALSLLWERQEDLIPLLKCFPAHKWEEASVGSFRFRSSLKVEDWDRVLQYSRRIRTFRACPYDMNLDESVMQSWIMSMPLVPIMPNLRVLGMRSDSNLFPYIRFLLGAQVSAINIYLVDLELEDPILEDPGKNEESIDRVSSVVTQLWHLHTVKNR
ncbi:hypothetical protein B0H14DRAFT_3431807 [Mycena olivaceomarginata]|nr:hypothetical protein B0H14DRAFT_3431807 [Mycena olivaceomarginata]